MSIHDIREIAHEFKPTWSDEQFEAHWNAFTKLKTSVARGRRKKIKKKLK